MSNQGVSKHFYSKKCWVKHNPALGKIWTRVVLTQRLGYCQEGWDKHLTQLLVKNNPIAGFVQIYPTLGCV